MKCEKFGTQDCGTEDYDRCEVSEECGKLAERVSQGKAKILDSSIMDKIKIQDSQFKENPDIYRGMEETTI